MLENDEITLVEGKTIRIVKENVLGNEERFSVNYPQAIDNLDVGSVVLLENGLMKIQVISVEGDGVTCKIINGGVLGNKKSLNVPGANLNIPFISDVDREDIIYACEHEGDYLAASFVSSKEDVLEVREIFKQCNREDMKIISKIESKRGIENLDEIIEVSDGIMVARGDLGVEVPMERVPSIQKMIINKCHAHGKISIVATEMMASMTHELRPTRAEVSDVANAVLDGADAVMLTCETTIGEHPVETINVMSKIISSTEENIDYLDFLDRAMRTEEDNTAGIIAYSVASAANRLKAKLIVTPTLTGATAKRISRFKPRCLILAPSPDINTIKSLNLNFGVVPIYIDELNSLDKIMDQVTKLAKKKFFLNEFDKIIITGSYPFKENGSTNFMQITEL